MQTASDPANFLLSVALYGFYIIPPAVPVFVVFAGPYYLWRRSRVNIWLLIIIGIISLLLSSYFVPRFYNRANVDQWTAGQVKLARLLNFSVFQPRYIVGGFTLVQNQIDGLRTANEYDETYYLTSTQSSANVEASDQYQLAEQPAGTDDSDYRYYCITYSFDSNIPSGDLGACTPETTNGVAWYRVNLQEHVSAGRQPVVGFVTLHGTIIVIRGTITPTDTGKVITSLHQVSPSAIKFHNNWAIYQGSQPLLPTW